MVKISVPATKQEESRTPASPTPLNALSALPSAKFSFPPELLTESIGLVEGYAKGIVVVSIEGFAVKKNDIVLSINKLIATAI